MWAQRRSHHIPRPLRQLGGRALRGFGGSSQPTGGPSEDWSVPLVPGTGDGNLETLPTIERDAGLTRSATAAAPAGPRLRCVIATGVLDVGGAEEFAASLGRLLPANGLDTTVVYADTRLPGQVGDGGRLVRTLAEAGVADCPPDASERTIVALHASARRHQRPLRAQLHARGRGGVESSMGRDVARHAHVLPPRLVGAGARAGARHLRPDRGERSGAQAVPGPQSRLRPRSDHHHPERTRP